jgi:hypothetical protein
MHPEYSSSYASSACQQRRTQHGELRQQRQVQQQPEVSWHCEVLESSGKSVCGDGMQCWSPCSKEGRLACKQMHNKHCSTYMAVYICGNRKSRLSRCSSASVATAAAHTCAGPQHRSPPLVDNTPWTTWCKCFMQPAAGRADSRGHSLAAAACCSISTQATTYAEGRTGRCKPCG